VHEKLRGILGKREGGEEGFGISKERSEGFVVEGSFSPSAGKTNGKVGQSESCDILRTSICG